MRKKGMFLAGIVLWLAAAGTLRADLTIWANNGEDKVTRDALRAFNNPASVNNSVWDGTTVSLFGGRNEVVNFNLVLEAGVHAVNGVTVQFDTLTGPGGATITSKPVSGNGVFDWTGRNIELFYIRYLTIKGLSAVGYNTYDERHVPERMRRPWSGIYGEALPGTGWHDRPDHDKDYPEIAVPLELVNAFNIAQNQNQSIWCDIYIPKTAAAGLYTGQVTVTENGTTRQVPVHLQVHAFSLPDVPVLKTMIAMSREEINRRYLGEPWPNQPGQLATSLLVTNRFFQMAHRHKFSLTAIEGASWDTPSAEWIPRLDGSLFSAANLYDGPGAGAGLDMFTIGLYGAWQGHWGINQASMQQHADGWVNWFNNNFPGVEYFLYLIDESTDFSQTEQWAQWIQNSPGPGKDLLTLATMAIHNAWQCPSVDIPATVTDMHALPADWEAASNYYRDTPGKRLFYYNGERPRAGTFATEAEGVSLRVNAWIQHKMGIHRWFFWESTFWHNTWGADEHTNVFQKAKTFGAITGMDAVRGETGGGYSNGDGVLFYPGTDLIYPQDSYNVQGPIGGLRLKHWRRGIQDGDYLALAKAIDPVRVQEIVSAMVPKALWEYGVANPNDPSYVYTDISWSVNPDVWEAARAELADIIVNQGTDRFHVSGTITLNGAGVQSVVLSGLPGNPVTNTSGQYDVTVTTGWNGTVTPVKAGYIFTPGHRDYANVTADQSGQDYTASTVSYDISGTVTCNGAGLANVVLSGLPGNPITDQFGQYTVEVNSGWSATVHPVLAGYTFTPATRTYSAGQTVDQSGQDYAASASSSGGDAAAGGAGGGGGGGGCFIGSAGLFNLFKRLSD